VDGAGKLVEEFEREKLQKKYTKRSFELSQF
jgi:hypothetical protein